MIVNKKPVSNRKSAAPAVSSHVHRLSAPRVAILHDSTIGKCTFRLRFKYDANGPKHVCIVHAFGISKKFAEDLIDNNLYPESMNGYDLDLLRFEPMDRHKLDLNDSKYSLEAAA